MVLNDVTGLLLLREVGVASLRLSSVYILQWSRLSRPSPARKDGHIPFVVVLLSDHVLLPLFIHRVVGGRYEGHIGFVCVEFEGIVDMVLLLRLKAPQFVTRCDETRVNSALPPPLSGLLPLHKTGFLP